MEFCFKNVTKVRIFWKKKRTDNDKYLSCLITPFYLFHQDKLNSYNKEWSLVLSRWNKNLRKRFNASKQSGDCREYQTAQTASHGLKTTQSYWPILRKPRWEYTIKTGDTIKLFLKHTPYRLHMRRWRRHPQQSKETTLFKGSRKKEDYLFKWTYLNIKIAKKFNWTTFIC